MTARSMPTESERRTCANHGYRAFQCLATVRFTTCCSRGDKRPLRQTAPEVLASLEQFRQSDVGVVRPPDDATRLLRCIVDARLFGIHVGAVNDLYPSHG